MQRAWWGGCYTYFTDEDTNAHEVTPFVQGHRANKGFGPEFKAAAFNHLPTYCKSPEDRIVLIPQGVEPLF